MKRLYLQLNEPGSGEIEVPLDSAMAADIVAGQWVDLKYNGDILGGFWVEELDKTQIDNGENAGRKLKASGRGALAILDDAIVWDWGTPALDNTRYFFTEDGGRYFTYPIFKKGQVLHQLIHEAIEAQTNPYGDSLDRKCWHSPTSTHLLAHVFDDANDSDGIPWDAAENEDLQARVGTSLLDLARQYSQLGQPTAPKVFDLTAVHDSDTGVTTFGIHQTAIGVTAANAIVHFRIGYNCTQVTDTENRADVRNAILTEFNDPSEPYATNTDPTSISAYRRREMLLQASNASSITEAGVFGLAQVNSLKDPKRSIAVKITDGATIKYGTHYNLGDWIYFDDGTGIEVQYRIVGIQLEWDDNYFADVVVTLNSLFMENEIRSARDLRKVGAQASGSSLMTQVSGSSGLGYWTRPPSDGAADGTVLTADGLGRSDWENVDGGSGVPGGTEHLKVLLHLDGADNSTTITDELAHTFAVTGAAALKIAYKKFGLSSLHCPPSVGAYAAAATGIPAHGTADFTWDCWVYLDALPTGGHWGTIMSQITAWNDANDCEIMINDAGHLVLYSYSWTGYYNDAITTARTIDVHVWHHIALVRASGVFYIYIDGFRDVNSLAQSRNLTGTNFHVGGQYLTGKDGDLFSGYIDEVAVWDNAHYTGYYFDPPTMPYVLSTHVMRGTTILFRRGPIANIPPLFPGEPFIALDTGALHIGDFVIAPGSGGYGDISGTGVVGQLAEFVTNTKTLQAAKLIAPDNLLTLVAQATCTFTIFSDSIISLNGNTLLQGMTNSARTTWIYFDDEVPSFQIADQDSGIGISLYGPTIITGGGTLALGGYTLTVPATGTVALSNYIKNLGNFYVEGFISIWRGLTDVAERRNWWFNTEQVNYGDFIFSVSSTNTGNPDTPVMTMKRGGEVGVGTTLAWFVTCGKFNVGNGSQFFIGTDNTQESPMMQIVPSYVVNTHASYTTRTIFSEWNAAGALECMRMESGTGAMLGFYGHVATLLQTGVAVTAAGIHTALVNLGLITA